MISTSVESNFTSLKQAVEFLDLEDLYSFNENLVVKYKLNAYTPQEGDRIAIFRLGWSSVKDYALFEWVPIATKNMVIFNKHNLPKNSTEFYQVCYIGSENEIHGASPPFQFTSDNVLTQSTSKFQSISTLLKSSTVSSEFEKDEEIKRLKEENLLFRESLKAVIAQKNAIPPKSYDSDIRELREIIDNLRIAMSLQQSEINALKSKILNCGEQCKKMHHEESKLRDVYKNLECKVENEHKIMNNFSKQKSFDLGDLESIPPFPNV